MPITGNKGEWSEIYTLFKILADKSLQPGNAYLESISEMRYLVIKVIRTVNNSVITYAIEQDTVSIASNNRELLRIPVTEFAAQAQSLLQTIQTNQRTFTAPATEAFMQSIYCNSLKASSSAKTDISVVVYDKKTQQTPTLGFSIKSQLGSPSTLLNAGRSTNFIYQVSSALIPHLAEINAINSRSKIKDRIKKIQEYGGTFAFVGTEQSIFSNNLMLIDSALPKILAAIIFNFFNSDLSKISDLVAAITKTNPIHYDTSSNHPFYSYKVKRLLTDIALGLMPATVWDGHYDVTGGFLIIKENGEILCYHLYDRNEFENYLLANTKLETASSSRHDFGSLYIENGKLFFKLNLQIRFLK
jgi:type II restriction enzyme